jgi:hypothetical protein
LLRKEVFIVAKRKAAKQKDVGVPLGTLLLAAVSLGILISIALRVGVPILQPRATASAELETNPPLPPESEIREFWVRELEAFFKERILKGQTDYSVLNAQLVESYAAVRKQYGHDLSYKLVDRYAKRGWRAKMGSSVNEGRPTMSLFIPSLMILKRICAHRRMFELTILVGFMHELDHFVLGEVGKGTLIESEKRTWARTCERTIRPLIELGAPVEDGNQRCYNAWMAAGRDEKSPQWDAFIKTHYRNVASTTPMKREQ